MVTERFRPSGGFLRHGGSNNPMALRWDGAWRACLIPLAHRLDDLGRAIPWRGRSPAESASISPDVVECSTAFFPQYHTTIAHFFEFTDAFLEDALHLSFEFVVGGDLADAAIEGQGVVVLDVFGDPPTTSRP